ncbi:MAG: hypothetical protein WD118_07815 [Phycisphaeraceae bacterium]
MPRITLGLGILLIALGVVGYFASGMASLTALIPAIPGGAFALLGALAMGQPTWRKHLMHAAVAFALLVAVLMAGMLLRGALSPEGIERPAAAMAQALMGLLSLAYVGLGVRSFIEARRARTRDGNA